MINAKRARMIRRGYGITAYVGINGSGKSAAMIYDTLPSLAEGRQVLSTVRLLDYENSRPCADRECDRASHIVIDNGVVEWRPAEDHYASHPSYIPWRTWDQLMEAEHCDVLADEITGIASGRNWSDLPAPILNLLCQLRRRDVVFRWTAPHWGMADSVLKRTTQIATLCTGYFPREVQDGSRKWRERRLFRWTTYDAAELTDVEAGRREKMRKVAFSLLWGPGSDMFAGYDTYDSVTPIGTVSDAGTCMRCGGTRRRPACDCSDNRTGLPTGRTRRRQSGEDPTAPRRSL